MQESGAIKSCEGADFKIFSSQLGHRPIQKDISLISVDWFGGSQAMPGSNSLDFGK